MHNGFYLSGDIEEALEETLLPGAPAGLNHAGIFLHGVCGVFALALHDRFGYDIWQVSGYDETDMDPEDDDAAPDEFLLHIYCVCGEKLIDVRGTTDDEEEFLSAFEDLCCTEDTSGYPYAAVECREFVQTSMRESEYQLLYAAAMSVIDKHPQWYGAGRDGWKL